MHSLFLYGPPGSGKSTLGKLLAERLGLPFLDLDKEVQNEAGMPVRRIFAEEGEAGFRAREKRALDAACRRERCVVALGGGTLLDAECREMAERSGIVVCLDCPLDVLRAHIEMAPGTRPLLSNGIEDSGDQLERLMKSRAGHYASFRRRLDVAGRSFDSLLDAAEILFGSYMISSGDVPSEVVVGDGLLAGIGEWARAHGMGGRAVVVGDACTEPLYGGAVAESLRSAGIEAVRTTIPSGEDGKTLATVEEIWRVFMRAGLGRGDFAVAVGGGVTGDLTGFAASAWMRGIRWINVPTTLLAMVDASTGGKTGCDLPGAKNMVGAFHSPSLVAADVDTLATLPAREWRCGLAEALKHAVIADPDLARHLEMFDALRPLADGDAPGPSEDPEGLAAFVSRALAVKVRLVRQDPRERDVRAKLNAGHTVGHAVEVATGFAMKHGEAVSVGMVEEARLAVRLGLAPDDWPDRLAEAFAAAGLPTAMPDGVTFDSLAGTMRLDKKKQGGAVRFALPCGWGDVSLTSVEV